MIFDVKMTLTRKDRLVAGGHTTVAPSSITCSSVVSSDSVRIAFIIAGINELKVSACNIFNAYFNAKCREMIWSIAGPEFPPEWQGKPVKILRALYGLKSSGWWTMFSKTLVEELQFQNSQADPDVWI